MELIKIFNGSLVDARELHQFLEIKSEFNHWVKSNLTPHFQEGKEFSSFLRKNPQKDCIAQKDYYLTLDTAKKVAMMTDTPKGAEARNYFLECEKIKLEMTKSKLEENIIDLGGTHTKYIQIDKAGQKVFFNGKHIPNEKLNRLTIKGHDFATALTSEILSEGNYKLEDVEDINKEQHRTIRDVIINNTNRKPEDLPKEQRIKKLGE